MRSLSAHDIVNIWERGRRQHPLDRALTMLAPAFPEFTWDRLASLPIHLRDAFLFCLYEQAFGPTLQGFAGCPQCKERLEFSLSTAIVSAWQENGYAADEPALDVKEEGLRLRFRFPNSHDLAAVLGCQDLQVARDMLARRCVVQAEKDGIPAPEPILSPAVIDLISERMAECEPSGEILLRLCCPGCGHSWNALFDIAAFLWAMISSRAMRLLREVNILARAYGWREADILSLSPVRRQFYLEMAT